MKKENKKKRKYPQMAQITQMKRFFFEDLQKQRFLLCALVA
jgi:hypothetical protein